MWTRACRYLVIMAALTLELAPGTRALFDQRDEPTDRDAVRQIARRLAGTLGPDVFSALVRGVD